MTYILVGLGNPGEKYDNTRHNTGRIALDAIHKKHKFPEWKYDKKNNALVSRGEMGKASLMLVKPETFMNYSGRSVASFVTSVKKAGNLIVVYDDLDLPLGKFKISFDRSSGGHKGLESVIKNIKTKAFWRIRVGISKRTSRGGVRKPNGEKRILDFLLDTFTTGETKTLVSLLEIIDEAIFTLVNEGGERAMSLYN